jgi:hypothetical protein
MPVNGHFRLWRIGNANFGGDDILRLSKKLFRAFFENRSGWDCERGGADGEAAREAGLLLSVLTCPRSRAVLIGSDLTKENVPRGSSTEEQRSRPPRRQTA